jgi:hypothetical protein
VQPAWFTVTITTLTHPEIAKVAGRAVFNIPREVEMCSTMYLPNAFHASRYFEMNYFIFPASGLAVLSIRK